MNVSCPECRSVFRVDPSKVPTVGVRARCSVCGGVISIAAPAVAAPREAMTPTPVRPMDAVPSPPLEASSGGGAPPAPAFRAPTPPAVTAVPRPTMPPLPPPMPAGATPP
ncbi:MAG: zinc-ribbon domain-containing protein, partial [Gemmatimonadetes bacterium]|nr:zinc-ribbon domain-containing protein [Gemmatimonadota bacterium]